MAPTEDTPLLTDLPRDLDNIYNRFTSRQKVTILTIVSYCGVIPFFISGSFFPVVPQIADEFGSSGAIASLVISISIFARGLGSLAGGSWSSHYGSRSVYIAGISIFCLGSIGVALSNSMSELIFWCFVQTLGASPPTSVGAAVIGNIYPLEQRGSAIGIYWAAVLLGPTLAPLSGGFVTRYASWRAMQWTLCAAGLLALVSIVLFLPETNRPVNSDTDKIQLNKSKLKFINPLRPLGLLRVPVLFCLGLATAFVLLTDFALLTPMAYTLRVNYDIKNEALLGCCFIPNGLGDIIGAPLAGRLSDKIIVKLRARRKGLWYPEDRLHITLYGAAIFAPLSILLFGIFNQYVPGKTGLILNLICLFMNGVGVQMVLGPASAYLIDIMETQGAANLAAINALHSCVVSLAMTGAVPLIQGIGVAAAYAIGASIGWIGFGILWWMVQYGDYLRSWSNIDDVNDY